MSTETNLCPLCGEHPASSEARDKQLCLICDKACTEDTIDELMNDRDFLFERAETAEKLCSILSEKLEELQKFINDLGVKNVQCRCGSGAHPRKCERHPWAFDAHIMELNYENARLERDEFEELKELKERLENEKSNDKIRQ